MVMSCITDDLDALFASSDFGEADGAVRNGDSANPISGIFDDEDVETQNGEGVTVLVPQTTFMCASSKVPDLSNGDTLFVRNKLFTIRFWQDDGTGVITLYLERPET